MNEVRYIILLLLWLVFGFLHSALATTAVKNRAGKILSNYSKYYRILYSFSNLLFVGFILYYNFSIPSPLLWTNPGWLNIVLLVTTAFALLMMIISMKKYFLDLSGIDVFMRPKTEHPVLQTNGLNKYVRHPLYTATLLLTASLFFLHANTANLISAMSIFIYTYVGVYFEEKKLMKLFGKEYETYALTHPKLIPNLKDLL